MDKESMACLNQFFGTQIKCKNFYIFWLLFYLFEQMPSKCFLVQILCCVILLSGKIIVLLLDQIKLISIPAVKVRGFYPFVLYY